MLSEHWGYLITSDIIHVVWVWSYKIKISSRFRAKKSEIIYVKDGFSVELRKLIIFKGRNFLTGLNRNITNFLENNWKIGLQRWVWWRWGCLAALRKNILQLRKNNKTAQSSVILPRTLQIQDITLELEGPRACNTYNPRINWYNLKTKRGRKEKRESRKKWQENNVLKIYY